MFAVADGGADDGRLQAGERALQQLVVAGPGLPTDCGQELVGREAQEARSLETEVLGLDDLARRPDQHVGVPNGRHAMLGHGVDLDSNAGGFVEDRRRAPRLCEREERPLHQVALIARAGVAGGDDERIELAPFAGSDEAARRHRRAPLQRCAWPAARASTYRGSDVELHAAWSAQASRSSIA